MESTVKREIALACALVFLIPLAEAKAQQSPTPKPTPHKTSAPKFVAVPKPTHSPSVKKFTKKLASKQSTKRYVRHVYRRRVVNPIPSPAAEWPPLTFTQGIGSSSDIYARAPTPLELEGAASTSFALTKDLQQCERLTCGAIMVTSAAGCAWWEIDSTVVGPAPDTSLNQITYGNLKTVTKGTAKRIINTVLLISEEPLADGVSITGITAKCYPSGIPAQPAGNTYTRLAR
jgi:hypothetical protein